MMDVFGSDFSCYHCQNGRSYSGAAPGFKAVNILFMNIISDYINNARYSRSVLMHSPATMSYLPDNPDFLSAIHDDEYIKELILPENVDTIDLGINSIDFVFDGISNLQIIVNCTTELLTYKEVLCALYFSTYKSQDFYDTHYRFQTKF
jgi:hypothetical protein